MHQLKIKMGNKNLTCQLVLCFTKFEQGLQACVTAPSIYQTWRNCHKSLYIWPSNAWSPPLLYNPSC